MEEKNQSPEKEVFNMSLDFLERISKVIDLCTQSIIIQDLSGWSKYLRALRLQISYKFGEDEIKDDNNFRTEINKLIPEFDKKFSLNERTGIFSLKFNEEFENYGYLFSLLESYQEFLLRAMNSRGMLFKTQKDASRSSVDL